MLQKMLINEQQLYLSQSKPARDIWANTLDDVDADVDVDDDEDDEDDDDDDNGNDDDVDVLFHNHEGTNNLVPASVSQ